MNTKSKILLGVIALVLIANGVFIYYKWFRHPVVITAKTETPPPQEVLPENGTTTPEQGTATPPAETPPAQGKPKQTKPKVENKDNINYLMLQGKGDDTVIGGYRTNGYIFNFDSCSIMAPHSALRTGKGAQFAVLNSGIANTYKVMGITVHLARGAYAVFRANVVGDYSIECGGSTRANINIQ